MEAGGYGEQLAGGRGEQLAPPAEEGRVLQSTPPGVEGVPGAQSGRLCGVDVQRGSGGTMARRRGGVA